MCINHIGIYCPFAIEKLGDVQSLMQCFLMHKENVFGYQTQTDYQYRLKYIQLHLKVWSFLQRPSFA